MRKKTHKKERYYNGEEISSQKTLLKCEACGEFHPEDETEIVYIRVVIGKECKLDQKKILNQTPSSETPGKQTVQEQKTPELPVDLSPEELQKKRIRERSIVPPGLRAAMIPPPELQPPR